MKLDMWMWRCKVTVCYLYDRLNLNKVFSTRVVCRWWFLSAHFPWSLRCPLPSARATPLPFVTTMCLMMMDSVLSWPVPPAVSVFMLVSSSDCVILYSLRKQVQVDLVTETAKLKWWLTPWFLALLKAGSLQIWGKCVPFSRPGKLVWNGSFGQGLVKFWELDNDG